MPYCNLVPLQNSYVALCTAFLAASKEEKDQLQTELETTRHLSQAKDIKISKLEGELQVKQKQFERLKQEGEYMYYRTSQ